MPSRASCPHHPTDQCCTDDLRLSDASLHASGSNVSAEGGEPLRSNLTCDEPGAVIGLLLNTNNMTGRLPARAMGVLSRTMHYMDLHSNALVRFL